VEKNELSLSARVSELENQVAELKKQIVQNNQAIRHSDRQIFLHIIVFPLVMFGTLLGTIIWLS